MSDLIICASAKKGKELDELFPPFSCQVVVPGEVMKPIRTTRFFHLAKDGDQKPGFSVRAGIETCSQKPGF
jgi:hypothetical protein